jgi:hypothetical protein
LALDPVRAVADRTARKIAGAMEGRSKAANVVKLGSGRRPSAIQRAIG